MKKLQVQTIPRPDRMRIILAGVMSIALLLAACQDNTTGTNAATGTTGQSRPNAAANATAAPLPTRVVTAETSITVDGGLTLASPLVTVGFEGSGKVTAIYVVLGQTVKKGDVLAEIDGTTLTDVLQKARESLVLKQAQVDSSLAPSSPSSVASAQAALASAYATYNVAKQGNTAATIDQALIAWNQAKNSLYSSQLNRDQSCGFTASTPQNERINNGSAKCKTAELGVKNAEISAQAAEQKYLDEQKSPTQNDLAKSWANVLQAQASLASAQGKVSDAQKKVYELQLADTQLNVARAERDLAQAKLLSPCACTVQSIDLTLGTGAGNGVTLLDTTQLQFHTSNLSEQDMVKLSAGQPVSIRLKAFDKVFAGKVNAVLPISSGTQGTLALYTAIIDLDQPNTPLLPGMTGQAEIHLP